MGQIKTVSQEIIDEMLKFNIWAPECPVHTDDLRTISLKHYNFDGVICDGEIIVHAKIAENVVKIFEELFNRHFPIHSIKLINEYQGSDEKSMEANNSSAFNYRKIAGTDRFSMHSYGVAIDINPLQNPYITYPAGKTLIEPSKGKDYLDRLNVRPGMVEDIVNLFKSYGFNWGGDWTSIKDYHHFELPLNLFGKR